ncbi:hypothetical protein J2Y67_003878 [Neobacillus niacini]|nr:hypothetical protein [Neobacillus niacini]MDR7001406.1 hypothetical protein [Neobacillus niacini]
MLILIKTATACTSIDAVALNGPNDAVISTSPEEITLANPMPSTETISGLEDL